MPVPRSSTPIASAKRLFAVVLTAAALALTAGGLSPSSARAAASIEGCFSYAGVRYENLSTVLLYSQGGYWHYWANTRYHTNSYGCVRYNLAYKYRNVRATIKAAAVIPEWRGVFIGQSPYGSPKGRGSWNLGEGQLRFYYLPPEVDDWTGSTAGWIDEMSSANCSSSAALAVACYMDSHGMHGNVVVVPKDTDGDGWTDGLDNYPENKYYY